MEHYSDEPQAPRASHRGCLWGCLGGFIAVAVVLVAVFGYGAWYFYKGFANDDRITMIVTRLSSDRQAAAVLGKNIKVLEVELHTFDFATGRGGTASYVLKVAGTRGHGTLTTELDVSGHETKIKQMVLVDSEGQSFYLVGEPPPNPMMQNSI